MDGRCKKEAADILHNRKLFDLTLDTPEYNIILEALILLDRCDEMQGILDEMAAAGVPANAKSNYLVKTKTLDRIYLHSKHLYVQLVHFASSVLLLTTLRLYCPFTQNLDFCAIYRSIFVRKTHLVSH
ncbi:hypothetical protein AaE_009129 [Aphanomyces astaci]|uniref:Pentacotripeptide-repeat region of PRORP domain-containing protein n=1 Tax=Aphanomyces astaci TaxID=112090 RepID=A0A6A4ZY40_APHAT|nr:hypothetical protein AaE_009129 [Aphanomyces astaci]